MVIETVKIKECSFVNVEKYNLKELCQTFKIKLQEFFAIFETRLIHTELVFCKVLQNADL